METYCGKSCAGCTYQEELSCPGCMEGPGRSVKQGCEIGICCREKGHISCASCTKSGSCSSLYSRDAMAQRRLRERVLEAEKQERAARKAPFFAKWLYRMFWLLVVGTVFVNIADENFAGRFLPLFVAGKVAEFICSVGCGLILLKLAEENSRYRAAGFCALGAAAVDAVVAAISGGGEAASWTLVLTLPAAVVMLISEYYEYTGHAESLEDVDHEMAEKWRKLWKWTVGILAGLIGSVVLLVIIPVIGLLIALPAAVGLFVVRILQIVYLYQTVKVYRAYLSKI